MIAQVAEVVLVVAAIVAAHLHSRHKMVQVVAKTHEQLQGHRDVQYKQHKQAMKELTATIRATARVSDDCARTLADARQLHGVMEEFIKEVRARG